MSRQTRGLEKEHELAKEIYDHADGHVIPLRASWSGNQAVPSPDLLIPFDGTLRAIELKTTGTTKITITPEDIEDLEKWTVNMTEVPTYPYLAVKFNRRKIYMGRLKRIGNSEICFEKFVEETPLNAWVTDGENLKIEKPDTETWPSMRAADRDDAKEIISVLENEHTELPSVTEIIDQTKGFEFEKDS